RAAVKQERVGEGRNQRNPLAIEPDRHAGLEIGGIALRIEAQPQRAAVVIADRAFRLPGRERAERDQLGDDSAYRVAGARPSDIGLRPNREAAQRAPAGVERQPLLAGFLDHEHWLAGVYILANLGDDHADDSVGRRPQYGLIEPALEHAER